MSGQPVSARKGFGQEVRARLWELKRGQRFQKDGKGDLGHLDSWEMGTSTPGQRSSGPELLQCSWEGEEEREVGSIPVSPPHRSPYPESLPSSAPTAGSMHTTYF